MNILLWVLQIVLALHTIMGAVWKFSNSEQSVSSLSAIPHLVWIGLIVVELGCVLGLILPAFKKSFGKLIPIAALCIAAEMLLFSVFLIFSSDKDYNQMIYWLVVAGVCVFLAYGRLVIKPIQSK